MIIESLKNKIISAKMLSGEEIIGRVANEDENHFYVKSPLLMVMVPGNEHDQQGMVAFAPWMLSITETKNVPIKKTMIMAIVESRKDAAEQYSMAIGETDSPMIGATVKSAEPVSEVKTASRGGRGSR